MFERKRCRNCGEKLVEKHRYCPNCGINISGSDVSGRGDLFSVFGKMFREMNSELSDMDKKFPKNMNKMPRMNFRVPGGGISITITSGTGVKPKVDVKTYGQYNKTPEAMVHRHAVRHVPHEHRIGGTAQAGEFKTTEEPHTEIKNTGNKQIITIELPGVEKVEDVEIRLLQHSIEVRAFVDDKLYFKLIPVRGSALERKEFYNGVLTLQVTKQ